MIWLKKPGLLHPASDQLRQIFFGNTVICDMVRHIDCIQEFFDGGPAAKEKVGIGCFKRAQSFIGIAQNPLGKVEFVVGIEEDELPALVITHGEEVGILDFGAELAIVTPVPGTTRDVLREHGGLWFYDESYVISRRRE